jgi:hypothetical protein
MSKKLPQSLSNITTDDIRTKLNLPKIGDDLVIANENPLSVIESKVMDELYEGHRRIIIQIVLTNKERNKP